MKRTAIVLAIVLLITCLMAPFAYAGDSLSIVGVTPKDGESGKQPQNMAVKVQFSANMMDEDTIKANEKLFSIKNAGDGTSQKFTITYNEKKYPNELWLVLDGPLEADTAYVFTAKAGIQSADGRTLAQDFESGFRTRDVKKDSTISMVMMIAMMGLMFFTSIKAAKKAATEAVEKQKGAIADDSKTNPYKIAKEKNISVEEAKKIVEKEKAKQAKRQAKLDAEKAKYAADYDEQVKAYEIEIRAEMEAERRANNYHVKRAGSMAAKGYSIPKSVVKANKKKREARAKAEKKAANKK